MTLLVVISLLYFTITTAALECTTENEVTDGGFTIAFEFHYINFTWESSEEYQEAYNNGTYIPEHNMLSDIKYYDGKFYFALPRTQNGAPVTLACIDADANMTDPLLTPYPSWDMNIVSCCNCLNNVFRIEIDSDGIMWVLDGFNLSPDSICPPKILLLDLNNNGEVIQSYTFPNDMCSLHGGYLNSLVLDPIDGGYAYITECSTNPGLIAFSKSQNKAWKFQDNSSMLPEPGFSNFTVNGTSFYYGSYPISGIALTPATCKNDPNRNVIYGPLSGLGLYEINSAILRNETLATPADIGQYITKIGEKGGPTSGMTADADNNLYFSILTEDAVAKWEIGTPLNQSQNLKDNDDLILWAISLGFDSSGNLYTLTENLVCFVNVGISVNDINFIVAKYYTGTCSYQF